MIRECKGKKILPKVTNNYEASLKECCSGISCEQENSMLCSSSDGKDDKNKKGSTCNEDGESVGSEPNSISFEEFTNFLTFIGFLPISRDGRNGL